VTDFIVPDWPAPARVRALITTRSGGVSRGKCASLNLARHVGDDDAAVSENRARLRRHLPADPLWLNQVHGVAVVRADAVAPDPIADAAVTGMPGVVCAVMTADCLPVLLCDEHGHEVGIAHAGWRGLAAGIVEATARAMAVPPSRLLAWLGPAIGPASFEVGDEVRQAFASHAVAARQAFAACGPGKWRANLYLLARQRLAELGVERVFGGGYDTFADAERFFSYRRSARSGRMASLIWIE
jgi:YfiH family protein